MRAKRQRLWLPDFPQLVVNEALLAEVRESQLSGKEYYGAGVLPPITREPRSSLSLVPQWETELHAEGARAGVFFSLSLQPPLICPSYTTYGA